MLEVGGALRLRLEAIKGNTGILERWNFGSRRTKKVPFSCFAVSIIPIFHYSIIPSEGLASNL
jgi:hypothetical protein